MKVIWYFNCLLSIIFILLYNPKAAGLSNLKIQGQVLNTTRNIDKTLELLTWLTILLFFIFIILFSIYKI
jgi:protein translocase SecG subunit